MCRLAVIRDVHKIMLCLDFEAADIEDGPGALRKASILLCEWLEQYDQAKSHRGLEKDGMDFFNSAFHNLRHVCDMADELWLKGRISIGRFTEQANEAINRKLKREFGQRCNNCRMPDLQKNMFVLALHNLWRDTFQYQSVR